MNERIKELAEQAGYKDLPTVRLAFQGFDKEKFAELIIRECASLAYDGPGGILEHFGIETDNIDWKEKFVEVYSKMMDLEMENIRLRKKIESLQKPPKKKVFVVCENEEEFAYYGRLENNINYVYLEHPEQLRGIHNPEVIYIGNWIKRRNIIDLITRIKMTTI